MPMYNRAKARDATFDWSAGGQTFRVLLVTSSYAPNVDHDFVSDVVANEIAGGGYVRKDVTTRTVTYDDANDRVDHNGDNITWTALTNTFRYAIVYRFVTVDADSTLIEYVDLGAQSLTAQDFTIKWNAAASNGTVFRGT